MTVEELNSETRIDVCRRIVRDHYAEEIDGYLVDAQTAHVLTLVWDALPEVSREKFETVPLLRLVDLAWRSVSTA